MTRINLSVATLLAVLGGVGFSDAASAVTCLRSGTSGGAWSVAANWSCFGGPSAGDDPVFSDGATTFAIPRRPGPRG